MMTRVEFRPAVAADAAALSAIARAAKAGWGYSSAQLAEWEPDLRISPADISRAILRVATVDGEAVAFCALEDRAESWSLEHFWVLPSAQRQGVGRRLFAHTLEVVRAARPGVVTIESDPHAAGFYARMGARRVGSVAAPTRDDRERCLTTFEVTVDAEREPSPRSGA